jgi:DNA-binding MarR family transcriptional regulator
MVDQSPEARAAACDQALELMYYGFKHLVEAPDRRLAKYGLSRVHHRIMYFVARRPALTVGELLAALQVTKQAVNRPLRELTEQGLTRARPDPRDGRVRRLTLTARGAALERTLTGMQHEHLARTFAAVGPAAEVGWRAVMRRLAE